MKMRKFLAILCAIAMLCSIAPMVSAVDSSDHLASADLKGTVGPWAQAVQIKTKNWDAENGPDLTEMTADHYFAVYFSMSEGSELWGLSVKLQRDSDPWDEFAEIYYNFADIVICDDGSYVVYITAEDVISKAGDNLSVVGGINIYCNANTNTNSQITVNKVTYTTGASARYPDMSCETVISNTETTLPGWWNGGIDIMTSTYSGALDVSGMSEGGALAVYYTGTKGQVYIVMSDVVGEAWGWKQMNTPSYTVAVDGGFVSYFTYAQMLAVYTYSDFTNLGKIVIGQGNADDIVVSKVVWSSGHSFTSKASDQLVSAADCDSKAVYKVQCDNCTAISDTVTVEVGEPNDHSFTSKASDQLVSAADCDSKAVYKVQCDNCAAISDTVTVEVGEPNDHSFTSKASDQLVSAADCDSKAVYKVQCDNCTAISDTVTVEVGDALGHEWDDATCTAPKTCKVCQATDGQALGHEDEDGNYSCDVCQADLCTEHDWAEATCDKAGYCKNCGEVNADDPAFGHKWTNACDTECDNEGCTETRTITHDWADATCTASKTCKVCQANDGEALGHKWTNACDTECDNEGCTETRTITHDWADATCTVPKTCKVCQATDGEALGHTWSDATCTAPETCSVCNSTKGEAAGHTWGEGVVTKEATTEAAGEKTYTCSACNSTKTEAIAKLPAAGTTVTEIYSGTTAVPGGWQTAAQVYATLWGGPLDAVATFTEGGYVEINLTATTADIWSAHVVLQGTGTANTWQQIDKEKAAFVENADGSYTVTVSFDELVTAYGGNDFSDLGCFYVYVNSDSGCAVTVNSINYVVVAEEEEDTAPDETTTPDDTTAPDNSGSYVEVTKEKVLLTDVSTGSGWVQTDINTTLWGGTLDASAITEGGELKIYFSAKAEDLWQIRLALNGAKWTELDWHVDPTSVANACGTIVDNGDGTFVVTFNYEDIVAAYGTDDLVGTLGSIHIASNAASDVTVTKVTYETVELVPETGDPIAMVIALMAASAMGITVLGKKKF